MPFDPENQRDLMRLRESLHDARQQLRVFHEHWLEALQELVGAHYGRLLVGAHTRVHAPLIEKAVTIYSRLLAAQAPQILMLTDAAALKSLAKDAEAVNNRILQESNFEITLQRWVQQSLLAPFGILKVGWELAGETEGDDGEPIPVGEAYLSDVSFDDWVHDLGATRLEEAPYMGHRFRTSLEEVRDNPLYERTARESLTPDEQDNYHEQGQRKSSLLSRGYYGQREDLTPQVELWELYLPREQLVVTIAAEQTLPALRVAEWVGPERGPYHFLYYTEVPNNSLPLAPVANWMDLHELNNTVLRKLARQAENQKIVGLYAEGDDESATRITEADDMEWVGVRDPQRIAEVRFNGPDAANQQFFLAMQDLFNNLSGNLDLLGGLGPQSDTVGQDQLISDRASERVEWMKDRVYLRTRDVCESIAWYYWHDPVRLYAGVRELPHTDLAIPVEITPEMRSGNWQKFNFEIVPHSMQKLSPAQRMNELRQLMQELTALGPLLEQQGLALNVQAYLETYAKYRHMPEVRELVTLLEGEPGEPAPIGTRPGAEGARMPAHTVRENVRRSVPTGGTEQSRRQTLMQGLMAAAGGQGGANSQQLAALSRRAAG